MKKELPLFSLWYGLTGRLLERAGRFSKGLRPTLGNRLIERALDVLETVVKLQYTRERRLLFREANLALERLRILLRLCFERRLLSTGQYEEFASEVDTASRMLGGWIRQAGGQPEEAGA